mmetsp:Transcript_113086/g.292429  ORF Transcript_113086/g.292429 Transcript_113086/m.292429 type:complete len:261 (-) Transcript_113086:10-792(-)
MAYPLLTLCLASAWQAAASAVVVGAAAKNASSSSSFLRASAVRHAYHGSNAGVPATPPGIEGEVAPSASLVAVAGHFNCKKMFKDMDSDKDGYVTVSEGEAYFSARGVTVDEHWSEEHNEADLDHDGRVSDDEFRSKCCMDMGCPPGQDPTRSPGSQGTGQGSATLVDSRALLTRRARAAWEQDHCDWAWQWVNVRKDDYVVQSEAVDAIDSAYPRGSDSSDFYRCCFRQAALPDFTWRKKKAASRASFDVQCLAGCPGC